jgi:hypothetical protein
MTMPMGSIPGPVAFGQARLGHAGADCGGAVCADVADQIQTDVGLAGAARRARVVCAYRAGRPEDQFMAAAFLTGTIALAPLADPV